MTTVDFGQQSTGVSIRAERLSFSYGAKTVLDGASFTLDSNSRSCLVGRNGVGKSTLLKILARELEPRAGQVIASDPLYTVAYVPQVTAPIPDDIGVLDFLLGRPWQESTRARMAEYHPHPSQTVIPGENRSPSHGWPTDHPRRATARAKKGLSAFVGLHRGEEDTPVATLSGGQKTRLFVLRALTAQPGLLLLDEPDNNLDVQAREWLVQSVRSCPSTVLTVGHRPQFVEDVAERILELSDRDHKVYAYTCGYSRYLEYKSARADADDRERQQLEKERGRLKVAIQKQLRLAQRSRRALRAPKDKDKIGSKHKSARAAQKHQSYAATLKRRLAQLPRLEKFRPPQLRIHIVPAHCGDIAVIARQLSKGYDKPLFRGFSMRIARGQRVAILGPNASGKTTLLKIVAGLVQPDAGECRLGKGVVIGYYPQEQEGLPESTVLDYLRGSVPMDVTSLRRELHHYQLTEDEVLTDIRSLSAGERARLFLLQFSLTHANVLLLDEPTNNLDPESRGLLADSLAEYDGTIIIVSHDRRFLNSLSIDRTLRLGDGAIGVEYGFKP